MRGPTAETCGASRKSPPATGFGLSGTAKCTTTFCSPKTSASGRCSKRRKRSGHQQLAKGEFRPHIEHIKYFFDRAWKGQRQLQRNRQREADRQKKANRELLARKIEAKRRRIQKEMGRGAHSEAPAEKERPPLSTQSKALLRLIEERLNEDSEEARLAEAGVSGSEFFRRFSRDLEAAPQQPLDPHCLGNKIESYLNRQRRDELQEFAELEKKVGGAFPGSLA